MAVVDAHVHLSDLNPEEVDSVMALPGIHVAAVSVDEKTSRKTLEIARRHGTKVAAFVGVHPSEAGAAGETALPRELVDEAAGCGEIGLDPRYPAGGPRSRQMDVFRTLLEMAEKGRKPVQVHTRDAENACLQAMSSHSLPGVLFHWFEDEESLPMVSDRGYFVSFGPALLYSKRLQRMAASFDRKLVLTESDGPVAFEALGGASGPSVVPSVAFKLSQLWRMGFGDASSLLSDNFHRFLGRP